ncbi:MAG TPA: hypothetical protein VN604_05130, partial [Nitrospirota bacterium]|nr:hypothetical protein [Nitrospirota bacterium]
MEIVHTGKMHGSRFILICSLFSIALLISSFFTARISFAAPPTVTITSPASGLTNDNTPLLT